MKGIYIFVNKSSHLSHRFHERYIRYKHGCTSGRRRHCLETTFPIVRQHPIQQLQTEAKNRRRGIKLVVIYMQVNNKHTTKKIHQLACVSCFHPSHIKGLNGRSMIRLTNISCSAGAPSRLLNPPDVMPAEENRSWYSTDRGAKSIIDLGSLSRAHVE